MFSAYARVADNTYREVFGLDFEQFSVGQLFEHRPGITISQQDNVDESLDTLNAAQLHYDAHYAKRTEWKQCLVVSTMTLQKVLGMTWKTFARKDRITTFKNIAMIYPVYAGDTLYAQTEILAINDIDDSDCGELLVQTRGVNQQDKVVTKIDYLIRVYRSGKHPYYGNSKFDYQLTEEKFSAYQQQADGSLKEQVGIYFEDLQPGEIYEHAPSKWLTSTEAVQHALHSLEWNPKYNNSYFYREYFSTKNKPTEVDCPIPESFIVAIVTAATTRTFGRVVANLAWSDIELKQEVFPNQQLTVKSKILEKRESASRPEQGIIKVASYCYNDAGSEVVSFERVFLIYKRGLGPYKKAGY